MVIRKKQLFINSNGSKDKIKRSIIISDQIEN